MADILADYREWRTQQAIRVSTHSDGCHMWHRDCMIHRLADALAVEQAKRTPAQPSTPGEGAQQERCTLTDAEREAIERAADWLFRWQETHGYHSAQDGDLATLRGLLERTK